MTAHEGQAHEPLTFESSLNELEEIVKKLEDGQLSLQDSLILYERGAFLRKQCEEKLNEARLKIDQITLDQQGKPTTTPMSGHFSDT